MKKTTLLGSLLASLLLAGCDRPAPPPQDVTVTVPPAPQAAPAVVTPPPAVVAVPGPPGPPGPQGPQGDTGPQGKTGDNVVVVPVPVDRSKSGQN